LLTCADFLPITSDLIETLHHWGNNLIGSDIQPEFINATKTRLSLLALLKGAVDNQTISKELNCAFPQIKQRNGLTDKEVFNKATHIVINPPFTMIETPQECSWTSGKVNSAAVFLEICVNNAQIGTNLVAILPDVLRSGSRYKKWRDLIQEKVRTQRIEIYGRFDRFTDVDVFILDGIISSNNKDNGQNIWFEKTQEVTRKIGDYFELSVGSVVPHRDPCKGSKFPFITSRKILAWSVVDNFKEYRRFSGRTFDPPFVAVKRTSSPSDKNRAVGSIIIGSKSIAVENHIIVLKPKNNSMTKCENLLKVLQNPKTNKWLNQRMRCRHLTISALNDIPWKLS